MARVLLVNQYYAPDTTSTAAYVAGIAEHLAAVGHDVRVVCGQPSYGEDAPRLVPRTVQNGVQVRRIDLGPRTGRASMGVRVFGYARFLAGAALRAVEAAHRRRPDVIITCHNPPLLPVLGALLARWTGARFVYIPWDLHPDILIATGFVPIPRPLERLWRVVNRFVFRSASRIVVLTDAMRDVLVEQGAPRERVEVIPLWPLTDVAPAPGAERDALALNVLYAGNMGVLQPLDAVLDAAVELADAPIQLILVGEGAKAAAWRDRAAREGLSRVRFLDRQPDPEFRALLGAADVGLVVNPPELDRLAFPSRIYTFLAAGKPLVCLAQPGSAVAQVVDGSGSGWIAADGPALAALLRELAADPDRVAEASRRASETSARRFSRAVVLRAFEDVVAR
jgi:putative colanic acid biosynthesis glycosyltransferase WcaI